MSNKHTPGPWTIHERDKESSIPFAVVIGGNSWCLPIADLTNTNEVEVCSNPVNYETIKANAALIAAAPELLEALQFQNGLITKCVGVLQRFIHPENQMTDSDAIHELYGILDNTEMVLKLRSAQSAIKKATT